MSPISGDGSTVLYTAVAGLLATVGWVLRDVVGSFRSNTNELWARVGKLEENAKQQSERIRHLEDQLSNAQKGYERALDQLAKCQEDAKQQRVWKHDWRGHANHLHLQVIVLMGEINEAVGRQKYNVDELKPPHVAGDDFQ